MIVPTDILVENPLARSLMPLSRHEFLPVSRIDETYPFNDV